MPKNMFAPLIVVLFFLSGFCNLVYEIVWARMFNLVFGVTVFAVSAVLAAFMLGMAVGGITFGRLAEKTKNNVVLFACVHAGIFLSALLLLLSFPLFQSLYLFVNKVFSPSFLAFRIMLFFLSVVFMIVPTTLMGATFPVAVKLLARQEGRFGKDIGVLYSVNTLGSVLGCIATIFLLLGFAGMKGTVFAAAAIDLAIGCAALLLNRLFDRKTRTA